MATLKRLFLLLFVFHLITACKKNLDFTGLVKARHDANERFTKSLEWNNQHDARIINIVNTSEASDLFICLDSGSGTLGEKQLAWLREILEKKRANSQNCFVVTHNNFFRT